MKWGPAIYEHKAALIGKTPAEVASSADLLIRALRAERDIYRADYLTVGLDVYNVEPEALGAPITVPGEYACPDIAEPILDINDLPNELVLPEIPAAGRFGLLLAAGKAACDAFDAVAKVRVAASGPVTIAAKLGGLEDLVVSLYLDDGRAQRLLEFTTRVAEGWCACLREHGLDAVVFDSMAAPPMFSPAMYERFVLPLHRRLMALLEASGQAERELVIGGNTSPIASLLSQTGANVLLCDYAADAGAFSQALGSGYGGQVRRNMDPRLLDGEEVAARAEAFKRDLALFAHPIAGTGILPYDFDPDNLVDFQKTLGGLQ